MNKKTRDPRQMPLDFDASVVVRVEHAVCERRIVTTMTTAPTTSDVVRIHAASICRTVTSFTDANTLALRRRAVQRVISAGIFPPPSGGGGSKD